MTERTVPSRTQVVTRAVRRGGKPPWGAVVPVPESELRCYPCNASEFEPHPTMDLPGHIRCIYCGRGYATYDLDPQAIRADNAGRPQKSKGDNPKNQYAKRDPKTGRFVKKGIE